MKRFIDSPAVRTLCKTASNMYRLGWDERNGGNISLLLTEADAMGCRGVGRVKHTSELGFPAAPLAGRLLLVTATGGYFKNIEDDPETNLGLIRISGDGQAAELLWGFAGGGSATSELPAHLMSHIARLSVDPENRVVLHAHPTNLLAMSFVHPLSERAFSHTLWQMCTECIAVFPEGVGVLPWMLCGTNEIGEATAQKMRDFRVVLWGMHGVYGAGKTLDEAFGLVETVEKAAQLYLLGAHLPRVNTITDAQLRLIADAFHKPARLDFLDE